MRTTLSSLLVLCVGLSLSCVRYQTVTLPPDIDLTQFEAVGIIQFSSASGRPDLASHATQRFVQHLTEAQPGIRIVELGTVEEVLARVGMTRLDSDAIREVGAKTNLQAVFVGSMEVTHAQPSFGFSLGGSMSVSADVSGTLTSTLYDTKQGAVMWRRSVPTSDSAGGGEVSRHGMGFAAGGEGTAYSRIISRTAFVITEPFRSHTIEQRVN